MATAQEHFRSILRERIAPQMRALGFRGSGQAYTLPDDAAFVQVGIQKLRYSTAEELTFTINLSVVSRAAWAAERASEPWRPAKPSANEAVDFLDGARDARIGHLLPGGDDTWWPVTPESDPDAVVDLVVSSVRDHGLPWIERALAEIRSTG